MTSRREFLKVGLAASALLPAGARASLAVVEAPAAVSLYKVLYDTRFAASVAFAQSAAARGVAVHAMTGDMTPFWYDDLYHRWRQEPAAIAGLTAHGALFCLERLAWEQRMRVVYRGADPRQSFGIGRAPGTPTAPDQGHCRCGGGRRQSGCAAVRERVRDGRRGCRASDDHRHTAAAGVDVEGLHDSCGDAACKSGPAGPRSRRRWLPQFFDSTGNRWSAGDVTPDPHSSGRLRRYDHRHRRPGRWATASLPSRRPTRPSPASSPPATSSRPSPGAASTATASSFTAAGTDYTGQVTGDAMEGTARKGGTESPWGATRK